MMLMLTRMLPCSSVRQPVVVSTKYFSQTFVSSRRWPRFVIPAGVTLGAGYFASFYFRSELSHHEVRAYRALPLKALSRLWGAVNSYELPVALRSPVYRLYSYLFNVNIDEAAIQDLDYYSNLGDFFRRYLRPEVRPIDRCSPVVCPCDGKVLHYGQVNPHGVIEQVKGSTYRVESLLGPGTDQLNEDNSLFQCVIYLAPGDYHGFHSPTNFEVTARRHFPGELLSVSPGLARLIRGLFVLNERAVYLGRWQHGFFSMTAVGATNVGNIYVGFDQDLQTNKRTHLPAGEFAEQAWSDGVEIPKGDSFGEFRLGSTIVLVFEAPQDFEFNFKAGEKVKMGQGLGVCKRKEAVGAA